MSSLTQRSATDLQIPLPFTPPQTKKPKPHPTQHKNCTSKQVLSVPTLRNGEKAREKHRYKKGKNTCRTPYGGGERIQPLSQDRCCWYPFFMGEHHFVLHSPESYTFENGINSSSSNGNARKRVLTSHRRPVVEANQSALIAL